MISIRRRSTTCEEWRGESSTDYRTRMDHSPQWGQHILFSVVFTPPPSSHHGSVWLVPVISLPTTNTVSPMMACLSIWLERFFESQKEDEHEPLSIQSSLFHYIEELILRGPCSSSFWFPRNLSNHMYRQACTCDSVLVKNRGMTGSSQHCRGGWGGGGVKTTENKIL